MIARQPALVCLFAPTGRCSGREEGRTPARPAGRVGIGFEDNRARCIAPPEGTRGHSRLWWGSHLSITFHGVQEPSHFSASPRLRGEILFFRSLDFISAVEETAAQQPAAFPGADLP